MFVLAVIVLSAVALSLYIAPLLPVVVGLITKSTAPSGAKGVLLVILAGIDALVAPAVHNGTSISLDTKFLGGFVVVLVVAIAAHFGILKPAGVTGTEGKVSTIMPNGVVGAVTATFGGGSTPAPPTPSTEQM